MVVAAATVGAVLRLATRRWGCRLWLNCERTFAQHGRVRLVYGLTVQVCAALRAREQAAWQQVLDKDVEGDLSATAAAGAHKRASVQPRRPDPPRVRANTQGAFSVLLQAISQYTTEQARLREMTLVCPLW